MNGYSRTAKNTKKQSAVIQIHGGLGVMPMYLLTPMVASDEVAEEKLGVLALTQRAPTTPVKTNNTIVSEEKLNAIFTRFWNESR